jgi:hypothetical protein
VLGELLKEDNSGLFMMMKVRLELPGWNRHSSVYYV